MGLRNAFGVAIFVDAPGLRGCDSLYKTLPPLEKRAFSTASRGTRTIRRCCITGRTYPTPNQSLFQHGGSPREQPPATTLYYSRVQERSGESSFVDDVMIIGLPK